jgi:transcriptional regulator GlxA family with amidase domain
VTELMSEFDLSGRQLERRFHQVVGIRPKLLCRILRFRRLVDATACGTQDWAALALDCGYYDQAHLIHDFREFTGQTPAAAVANGSN